MITVTKERTFRNISYSLVAFMWPVLIAFIVTPIIVNFFGIKEYGIYIFINTLISFAGLLDVGFASAVSKFIAEKQGKGDRYSLQELFKTSNTVFFVIGSIGGLLIATSIYIGLSFFPSELVNSYQVYAPAFLYGGILFFINSINSLHVIIPTAYQRFDVSSKIGILFITVQQLGILLVVFFGGSINTLFLLQTVLMLFFYFIYKRAVTSIVGEEKKSLNAYGWNIQEFIHCYKFGVVSFLNNMAGVSLTYLDRMIVPIFLGPSNLAYYSLPGSITNKIPTLSITLSSVVFPMTSNFEGGGDREMTKKLYIRSMRLITVMSTAISLTFIAFAYQLLQYWINEDLAEKATNVLVILAITNLILAITNLLTNVLLGMGRLKSLITASVCTALLNGILLLLLMPKFGIEGAAYAYLLALVPYIFLIYVTEKKYLVLEYRKKYYFNIITQLLVVSFFTYIIDVYIIVPYIYNFASVIIASMMSTLIFIGLYYMFGFFEKDDVDDITSFSKRTLGNFRKKFFTR